MRTTSVCDCILSVGVTLEDSIARKLWGGLFSVGKPAGHTHERFSPIRTEYMAKIIFIVLPLKCHEAQAQSRQEVPFCSVFLFVGNNAHAFAYVSASKGLLCRGVISILSRCLHGWGGIIRERPRGSTCASAPIALLDHSLYNARCRGSTECSTAFNAQASPRH